MKNIFVKNCPRCLTPINKELPPDNLEIRCEGCLGKHSYSLHSVGEKIECSYYYGGYFIWSSERYGETAFSCDRYDGTATIWVGVVLDPLISNEDLDKLLLLL